MELMVYYRIKEINSNDSIIELYGSTITNRDFYIKFDIKDNKQKIVEDMQYNNIEYYFTKQDKSRTMMYRKRGSKWKKVGDDIEFSKVYFQFMTLRMFSYIHKLIMENI